MNRRRILGLTSIVSIFTLAISVFITSAFSAPLAKTNASNAKTVTDVTSISLTMSNDVTIAASSFNFTDGNLFSLSNGGYFRTEEPIRGITSIEIGYAEGSGWAKIVPIYYDFENDELTTLKDSWPDASTSADFSSSPIDYFELYNGNDNSITITSISITYSCSTASYSFTASFTPNWNNKTAENHAEVYIVGTQELVPDGDSQGGWYSTKMSYVSGTYVYNAPNKLVNGYYAYTFVAVENGQSYGWNPCIEGTVNLLVGENIVDTTTSSSTAGKTTQKSATTSKTTAKTTTSTANTTSTTVKVTTVETETTQTDITTEVTASPVTTTVFVPRPPDYGTEWNEVDIKPKDPNQHGSTMLKPFKLDEVVNNADLVFRGTITDRKEYEVSWTDDNGQNWGPYGNGVFEVRVDEVYYGQSDKETLKIYFPSCFRQSGDGIFGLNDSQEYIFIANAFDNDYYAHLAENPLDRTEPYKHADMYINGTRENALPIINDIVLPYYDFFKDNESVLAKDIPYEEVQELLPEEAKYPVHLRFRKEDIIGDIKALFTR